MPNLNEYFCRIYENMQGRYEQKKKIKVRLWPQFEMFACTILGFKMAKLLSTSHNYHFTLRHSWHLVCIDNTGINMEKKLSYCLACSILSIWNHVMLFLKLLQFHSWHWTHFFRILMYLISKRIPIDSNVLLLELIAMCNIVKIIKNANNFLQTKYSRRIGLLALSTAAKE